MIEWATALLLGLVLAQLWRTGARLSELEAAQAEEAERAEDRFEALKHEHAAAHSTRAVLHERLRGELRRLRGSGISERESALHETHEEAKEQS